MESRYNKIVTCRKPDCRRVYMCLPCDPYYDASPESTEDGLCRDCFLPKIGQAIVMKTLTPLSKS